MYKTQCFPSSPALQNSLFGANEQVKTGIKSSAKNIYKKCKKVLTMANKSVKLQELFSNRQTKGP